MRCLQALPGTVADFEFLGSVAQLGDPDGGGWDAGTPDDRDWDDCHGPVEKPPLPEADGAVAWHARLPVPGGASPRFAAWAWRGRHAVRDGRPVWISGAGVVVRRGGRIAEEAPDWVRTGFAAAHEAAHGPRLKALHMVEQRAARDARASAADQAYRAWLCAQGRAEGSVTVPPEPRSWEVPGDPSWLAEGLSRVMQALRRRDWRQRLEALRRTEPLLVGAVIASLPTPGEEQAAWRDGLAREAGRAERRKTAPGAGTMPYPSSAAARPSVPPVARVPRVRRAGGKGLRTMLDATDILAKRAEADHS